MSRTALMRRCLTAALLSGAIVAGSPSLPANASPAAGAHAVAVAPIRARGQLGPLINIPQTWNNCGPSSVAEVLAYWGIGRTQQQTAAVLRADGNPRGMAPYGVPAYMRSLGMRALLGIDGSERLIRALVSNGFPVIVSQWVSRADHVGHYRPIQAYDDRPGTFISSDPYLGQNHPIAYDEFDAIWRSTNRRFMVLYPPGRAPLLRTVLESAGWEAGRAYRQDLARTRGLLAGTIADLTGYGSPRTYYLAIAWDHLQLGQGGPARQALGSAILAGANAVVARWIGAEIARTGR